MQSKTQQKSASLAGRVPLVKSVCSSVQSKVLLQHDWASVLLLMPARDFEQWEHGLRLSDKPQGKHIRFSSYCLSSLLCCVVLYSSGVGCHLKPRSHWNPVNAVTYWTDVKRSCRVWSQIHQRAAVNWTQSWLRLRLNISLEKWSFLWFFPWMLPHLTGRTVKHKSTLLPT